jgi:hypothetical protein
MSSTTALSIFGALATVLALWLAGTTRRLRLADAAWPPMPSLSLLERPG